MSAAPPFTPDQLAWLERAFGELIAPVFRPTRAAAIAKAAAAGESGSEAYNRVCDAEEGRGGAR